MILTGQVGYEEGHAYNLAFDVGLIPFTPTPMNDAINSVKMFMYLMAGKPIVSTWVEECRRNPFVMAAQDTDEFANAIRRAVEDVSAVKAQERIEYALANTWEHRAETAIQKLTEHGMFR